MQFLYLVQGISRMIRWSIASLLVALLALLGLSVIAADDTPSAVQPPVTPVKVVIMTEYGATEAPNFAGRTEAGDSAALAFRVAGQLRALKVQMGQNVRAGEVLAELDPTDYALNLQAREAEFELARLGAQRASTLFAKKLISEDEFDTARTLLTTSRARLEQATERLSYCKLLAPFDGSVAFTYAMPSEVVAANQPVLNLQDFSELDIRFNLPPQYQPLIAGADRAVFHIVFDLFPDLQLPARYKEVSLQPDLDTNSYPVTLRIETPDGFSPRPGMSVRVVLGHPSLMTGTWVLPEDALFDRSGNTAHVWRIDESTMTIHRTSIAISDTLAVLDGLSPGDRIIAAGVDRLTEGQKVRVWRREGGL